MFCNTCTWKYFYSWQWCLWCSKLVRCLHGNVYRWFSPKVRKNCAPALYVPFHPLFSLSLSSHILLSEWSIHVITPGHKSGDKSLVNDYRTVWLLCYKKIRWRYWCGFWKPFAKVPHCKLLLKLKTSGLYGILWHWFKAYLGRRQHCVRINNEHSDLLPVELGVPQGSIIGPTLSLL